MRAIEIHDSVYEYDKLLGITMLLQAELVKQRGVSIVHFDDHKILDMLEILNKCSGELYASMSKSYDKAIKCLETGELNEYRPGPRDCIDLTNPTAEYDGDKSLLIAKCMLIKK